MNSNAIHVATLNCAKDFPFLSEESLFSIVKRLIPENIIHDLYAFGFQELVSIWQASFPNTVDQLMNYLVDAILKHLNSQSHNAKYKLVGSTSTGAVGVIVLVRDTFTVEKVAYSKYRCGLFNSSLKGSATVCCTIRKSEGADFSESFTFICSHLAANEGPKNTAIRISNYRKIMGSCNIDLRHMPFKFGHVFFFGDLNFRVNGWHDMDTNYSNEEILKSILENNEELNQLRKSGKILNGFDEAAISFPPTYKYTVPAQHAYNKKRTPSWCDRVLFREYKDDTCKCVKYEAIDRYPELRFTDHQAVVLDLNIPSKVFDHPFEIEDVFISRNQKILGFFADRIIGYVGWSLFYKLHYGLLFGLLLFVLYKIY